MQRLYMTWDLAEISGDREASEHAEAVLNLEASEDTAAANNTEATV